VYYIHYKEKEVNYDFISICKCVGKELYKIGLECTKEYVFFVESYQKSETFDIFENIIDLPLLSLSIKNNGSKYIHGKRLK
jgi:hypothetical protein